MHRYHLPIPIVFAILTAAFLFFFFAEPTRAQDKLIILVRHAEKADDESNDPGLSEAGKQRSERLARVVGRYRPGGFYSTNFIRTRETLAPFARKRQKEVKLYNPREPQKLIEEIMQSRTKRFIVAGHSNSIPGLANLLTKKELFKNLDDSEYTVIWLIRIKNGKVSEVRLLDY
ncbi:MAG TPA: phosphoglycerate mutase family protein [Pyrinomonadaceae bacterium]|nr:phosphoglycerate mutase family protein [Pyrinomonadaceae bacterium]HMP64569.1 phosphoglycerate mutase family protein [Pyrinomonadaceae bacterium]